MKMPFISRARAERAVVDLETEIWDLRGRVKQLREREDARIACMEVLERDCTDNRLARETLELEVNELRERVLRLNEDNKELRRRYDVARAQLQKAGREVSTLRLMKTSLEARLAAPSEVS